MTIQDLGSIGEIVGAIATVATLLYLAVQIRANTRAVFLEARRGRVTLINTTSFSIAENPEVAALFHKGLGDPESLRPTETTRFDFLISTFVAIAELAFTEQEERFSTYDDARRGFDETIRLLCTPGGAAFWNRRRSAYTLEFRDQVDESLAANSRRSETAAQQNSAAGSA